MSVSAAQHLKGKIMANADNPGDGGTPDERRDAAGQYRQPMKTSDNNGVASAKPRVTSGSDDATVGAGSQKDGKVNYDPADMNEGQFRG